MPWFAKTETFTRSTRELSSQSRRKHIDMHIIWIKRMQSKGIQIYSGYLTDHKQTPGGGGLLIFKAKSFSEAKKIIEKDPMISAKLVTWKLHEWNLIAGDNL
ncbi:YciI family protein [Prochlorococcus sp. MIT 1341]|uniref:YciI family protein n=1 Tax=Prochlorococcus sp. MIT 1341 TaxID=3096221 RepID=UPI002A75E9FA|nr:YciI family protein [Prochlorococcus sp. MIT 1341]